MKRGLVYIRNNCIHWFNMSEILQRLNWFVCTNTNNLLPSIMSIQYFQSQIFLKYFLLAVRKQRKTSEYDQEMPQSQSITNTDPSLREEETQNTCTLVTGKITIKVTKTALCLSVSLSLSDSLSLSLSLSSPARDDRKTKKEMHHKRRAKHKLPWKIGQLSITTETPLPGA